jgi:GNAT superfamily N-acetyltransferase
MARLRRLGADEARARTDELLALARRAKATWGHDDAFLDRFVAEQMGPFDAPGSVVVVAEAEDALVGFAMVVDRGEVAWLEDLWVDPLHQRSGVGAALVAAACDLARSWGSTAVELESDPDAEPFYLAQGAVRIGVRASTLRPGIDLPQMRFALQ